MCVKIDADFETEWEMRYNKKVTESIKNLS